MIKKTFYCLFLSLTILFLSSCVRTRPILNYKNQPVSYNFSTSQIKKCIEIAAIQKGWSTKQIRNGLMKASINVRNHYAAVYITYSHNSYSIQYHSSHNLMAKGGMIHRNYNRWVSNLNNRIKNQINKAKLRRLNK